MAGKAIEYVVNRMAGLVAAGVSMDEVVNKMMENPEVPLSGGDGTLLVMVADRANKRLIMKNISGVVLDDQPLLPYVEMMLQQMVAMQISEITLSEQVNDLNEKLAAVQANSVKSTSFTRSAQEADSRLSDCGPRGIDRISSPLEIMIGGFNHSGKTILAAILIDSLKKRGFNNIVRIDPEEADDVLERLLDDCGDVDKVPGFANKEIRINANLYASFPGRQFKLDPRAETKSVQS